ncbi:hypothetical protein KBB27_01780 [Patescibacteria group bacterium]|nr:hypothetical protein [Patescibacteria group bacterium]
MSFFLPDLALVKERFFVRESAKRELATVAQRMQTTSKRAIFAVHRDDLETALALLEETHEAESLGEALCRQEASLAHEGIWRAAREEQLEAELLVAILLEREIALPTNDPERVIGACSDVVGELARVLVRDVTQGDLARVERLKSVAQDLLGFLLEFDATGGARQKVDQARQHLRKIEDVAYDLAVRRGV